MSANTDYPLQGGTPMFNTIKWIIISVLLLAVTIGACLYFIPQTTTINLTLETLKTDRSGNELGSVTITVTGTWEKYLLQDDRLVLTIDDKTYDID